MRGWSVDAVVRIADEEARDGRDHWLSHFVMTRKVLRQSPAFSISVANSFAHRRLTRDECNGLLADFADETTWPNGELLGDPLAERSAV